jgi:photosystem II stability/assembly factor-like uncharacterized protein
MKGDFSRDVFHAANHTSAVLLGQGGLLTDSDWKEQSDLVRYRIETEARDVIGPCGGPIDAAAFALSGTLQPFAIDSDAGSPGAVWIATADGFILHSTDSGVTWAALDSGTSLSLHAVRFAGAAGWAVGHHGAVLHTPDTGVTWVAQQAGTAVTLRALAVADASNVWAAGDAGVVVFSDDGGATWTQKSITNAQLNDVAFTGIFRGVTVGAGGALYVTNDGGTTWQQRTSNTTESLRAAAFVDASNAWVVGDGGTILHTADGGETWTAQASGQTVRLLAVDFTSATTGVAVGDNGTLIQTSNGGATWTALATGLTEDLRSVALLGNEALYLGAGPQVHSTSLLIGATTDVPLPLMSLSIGAGRYYVQGTLCEVEAPVSYYNQPDRGRPARLAPGPHLVFVQAWQRHLSAIESPAIREVALGEADPSSRAKTIWQVRTLPLAAASPSALTCASAVPELDAFAWPPAARMTARAEPQAAPTSLCDIGAAAGFRRLENQLYRVEIQQGGATPRFKWSRENGSVAFAIESIGAPSATSPVETAVRLRSRGRDSNLDLATGDWVEIVNDDLMLEDRAGPLFQFKHDGTDALEIVLDGAVPASLAADPSRHPLLRRWEQKPTGQAAVDLLEEAWIDLEDGVQVRFELGGTYRPGDYWLIPARTVTADVEWPRDDSNVPLPQPPKGIEDRICRLGIIDVAADGTITGQSDCRNLFPPLTALDQLLYVSGDGQDGAPGTALPQALVVRVARGRFPMPGVTVQFGVESGNGSIAGAAPGTPLDVSTDANGLAQCLWTLDADQSAAARHQVVTAHLLDGTGAVIASSVVRFAATATLTLVGVGGDGQDAPANTALAQPLEVRVANGQTPFAGAQINFAVVAGGGSITSANPVATSAQGLASASWQLGGAGTQRVEAQWLDGGGAVIQSVAFNGQVREAAAGGGGGCSITVGEGGDFPKLTTEIVNKLLEKQGGRLCLCFMAGVHDIEELAAEGNGQFRLSIHGCGRAATLRINRPIAFNRFEAIELSDVTLEVGEGAGVVFAGCDDVQVANLQVLAPSGTDRPVLFFRAARAVRVDHCVVTRRGGGLSLLFDEECESMAVIGCEIQGMVCFYGRPGSVAVPTEPPPELDMRAVLLEQGRGRLRLLSNRLDLIYIGRSMFAQIAEVASGQSRIIRGLIADALIEGNTFLVSSSVFISARLSLTGCAFMGERDDNDPTVARFISGAAAVCGTVADQFGDGYIIRIITPKGFTEKAANMAFILSP